MFKTSMVDVYKSRIKQNYTMEHSSKIINSTWSTIVTFSHKIEQQIVISFPDLKLKWTKRRYRNKCFKTWSAKGIALNLMRIILIWKIKWCHSHWRIMNWDKMASISTTFLRKKNSQTSITAKQVKVQTLTYIFPQS